MLSKLIVSSSSETQINKVNELLKELQIKNPHPDLLWISREEGKNLGVKDARIIRDHLSFKPRSAQGKVAVVIGADSFSLDAQNSLLKTLEEPPATASIILTADSTTNLLPTILSRCEIIQISDSNRQTSNKNEEQNIIEQLFKATIEERFQIIEKTQDREALFEVLVEYITAALANNPKLLELAKLLQEAQMWQKHQGNIRTILEYLMLSF